MKRAYADRIVAAFERAGFIAEIKSCEDVVCLGPWYAIARRGPRVIEVSLGGIAYEEGRGWAQCLGVGWPEQLVADVVAGKMS